MDLNGFYQKSEDELLRALNQFREEKGESFKRSVDKFINEKVPGAKPGFVVYHNNWSAYVTPNEEKIQKMRVK